jgi:hypothetical protein
MLVISGSVAVSANSAKPTPTKPLAQDLLGAEGLRSPPNAPSPKDPPMANPVDHPAPYAADGSSARQAHHTSAASNAEHTALLPQRHGIEQTAPSQAGHTLDP